MSDIFREVDEDLRREQLKNVWNKYGIYFLALAALLVLGAAGWRGYEYYENQRAASSGDRFMAAVTLLDDGKNAEAAAAFEALSRDTTGRYPSLALMASAGAKAAAGDVAGAVADFDRAAAHPNTTDTLRTIARLRAAYLLVDTAAPEELKRRVGEFDQPNSPYRRLAAEILGLAAWRAGDMAEAARRFDELALDRFAPEGIQRRAGIMRQLIEARAPPPAASTASTPASSGAGQ